MKILGLYITTNNYKKLYKEHRNRLDVCRMINRGFADEIVKLEKEIYRLTPIKGKDGKFISKKKAMTETLRIEVGM